MGVKFEESPRNNLNLRIVYRRSKFVVSKTGNGKGKNGASRRNNEARAKPIFRGCGTAFIREFNGSIRTVGSP